MNDGNWKINFGKGTTLYVKSSKIFLLFLFRVKYNSLQ